MAAAGPVRLVVSGLAEPERLDRYLRSLFPEWGRQAVGRLIQGRQVRVNDRVVWLASWELRNGDRVEISQTPAARPGPLARFDERWLIAEEPDLVVVNKPAGVLAHATRAQRPGDLLSLAQARFGPLALFHRLDRDTSGVVLLTRSRELNRFLDRAFKAGQVAKRYLAATPEAAGLHEQGSIEERIGPHPRRSDMMTVDPRGQRAATRYRLLGSSEGVVLLELEPVTGRTHQLRVHLAALGAPILGDRLYGPRPPTAGRLLLHAWHVSLPAGSGYPERSFEAPLPADFRAALPAPLRRLADR